MSESMIERVARALREEDPIACYMFTDDDMRDFARAAIKAIREPTPDMHREGERAIERGAGADSAWRHMIDAALQEQSR